MGRFTDFDAAWSEQADPPSFKAFGRTFTLPGSPPVKLTLMAMRAAESDPDGKVGASQVADIAGMLIGREATQTLLNEGITFDQLADVIRFAKQAYADEDENPPTAGTTEPAEPSSPTGDISKPTSNASTDWIS